MSQQPSPNSASDNGTPTNNTTLHFSKLSPISPVAAASTTRSNLFHNSRGGKHLGGKRLGGKTRIAYKKKKSNLTFEELEMNSEEDEENITVEVIGYKETRNQLINEKPLKSSDIRPYLEKFVTRIKDLYNNLIESSSESGSSSESSESEDDSDLENLYTRPVLPTNNTDSIWPLKSNLDHDLHNETFPLQLDSSRKMPKEFSTSQSPIVNSQTSSSKLSDSTIKPVNTVQKVDADTQTFSKHFPTSLEKQKYLLPPLNLSELQKQRQLIQNNSSNYVFSPTKLKYIVAHKSNTDDSGWEYKEISSEDWKRQMRQFQLSKTRGNIKSLLSDDSYDEAMLNSSSAFTTANPLNSLIEIATSTHTLNELSKKESSTEAEKQVSISSITPSANDKIYHLHSDEDESIKQRLADMEEALHMQFPKTENFLVRIKQIESRILELESKGKLVGMVDATEEHVGMEDLQDSESSDERPSIKKHSSKHKITNSKHEKSKTTSGGKKKKPLSEKQHSKKHGKTKKYSKRDWEEATKQEYSSNEDSDSNEVDDELLDMRIKQLQESLTKKMKK